MTQGNPAVVAALNENLNEELRAIITYTWMSVTGKGMLSPAIAGQFMQTAKTEMGHAEKLANRLDYYGAELPAGPWSVQLYSSLEQMVQAALTLEQAAIKRYKAHSELAARLGDSSVRLLLEEILQDEEEHAHYWETVLGS